MSLASPQPRFSLTIKWFTQNIHGLSSRDPAIIPRFPTADVSPAALDFASRAETKWWFSHPSQVPPCKPVVVDANVADVLTRRDATERLTRPSPQRAALRLSGARVLRRGTERCWTRLITAGRPRILEPAGFIINPRLQCRPSAPSCPPFHLLRPVVARLPPLLPLLLFPTNESRQHEIPA